MTAQARRRNRKRFSAPRSWPRVGTRVDRRRFLTISGAAGAALLLPWRRVRPAYAAPLPGGTLGPTLIPKYVTPLVIPPAMPRTARLNPRGGKQADYYEIAVRQFQQQILPPGLPATTVWGFGSVNHPGTFNYPAFTIEARCGVPVRVKWINDLKHPLTGNYLPHLLPVDQTVHWANPPGGQAGRDGKGTDPTPYTGPVPFVTHLHGGHTDEESDGYAEAWFLPAAANIPAGFATAGSHYDAFRTKFFSKYGVAWEPGTATFQYANDQAAATLWYHDHTLGMTRANVYAGPAGFYLLRGGAADEVRDHRGRPAVLPGPAPALGDRPGAPYYEIPLGIQDRSFNADGSLFYPASREFFDGFSGPYSPESDIAPIWNPEFFGNTIVVNGRTWPYLSVEKRRYRFRILNGCNSRFLILRFSNGLPFWQIGAEGGFLAEPVALTELLLAPAERADVIVDFTRLPVGAVLILQNLGPDEPFGGGVPGVDFAVADPGTTGQVMQFRVRHKVGPDRSTPPAKLVLPSVPSLPEGSSRRLSLNEIDSEVLPETGPQAALLGSVDLSSGEPVGVHEHWEDPITIHPQLGATEIWELYNFTADAHPIHLHLVQFQVVNRQPLDSEAAALGSTRPPEPGETGFKDTVIAYPGEITRVKATFDKRGLYAWHCHIVEHEDNEMMRPFRVT